MRLRRALKVIRPDIILDIGCGTGTYAFRLHGLFESYVGLDPSSMPEGFSATRPLPSNAVLIKNDPETWPIAEGEVDLVSFIASYDHIPNRAKAIKDAWSKLRPGGHLLINLTNYGYWLKRIANCMLRRQILRHEDEHFCVHSVESLTNEVRGYVEEAKLIFLDADSRHIPNLPHKLSFIYFSPRWIRILNSLSRFLVTHLLRIKNRGAVMIVVFQKQ